MNTQNTTRAKNVMPPGYHPGRVTEPPTDRAQAAHQLVQTASASREAIGTLRLARHIGLIDRDTFTEAVDAAKARARTAAAAIAVGAAALALAMVAAVAAPAPHAEAMEAPQPDLAATAPAANAVVYRVVLAARTVTLPVPIVARRRVNGGATGGTYCASVWGTTAHGVDVLGQACSQHAAFTVHARIDATTVPLGRSTLWLLDEGVMRWLPAVLDARRPSRFGVGTYTDQGQGRLAVAVQVRHYSPAAGAWVASQRSPVQVQVLGAHGWQVKGTVTTNAAGYARGVVAVGWGRLQVRLVRPNGAGVWGTTGRTRTVTVTEVPLDIN